MFIRPLIWLVALSLVLLAATPAFAGRFSQQRGGNISEADRKSTRDAADVYVAIANFHAEKANRDGRPDVAERYGKLAAQLHRVAVGVNSSFADVEREALQFDRIWEYQKAAAGTGTEQHRTVDSTVTPADFTKGSTDDELTEQLLRDLFECNKDNPAQAFEDFIKVWTLSIAEDTFERVERAMEKNQFVTGLGMKFASAYYAFAASYNASTALAQFRLEYIGLAGEFKLLSQNEAPSEAEFRAIKQKLAALNSQNNQLIS